MQVVQNEYEIPTTSRKRKRAVVFVDNKQVEEDITEKETIQEDLQDVAEITTFKPPIRLTQNLEGSYRKIPLKSVVKDATKTLLMNQLAKSMSVVTVEDLFLVSVSEIQRELNVPQKNIQALIEEVSLHVAPQRRSTLQLESDAKLRHRRLSTGCNIIDQTLGGGIVTKSITEIVGESSSGKTQFCLQLSLRCPLPEEHGGLGGKVLYITTNGEFAASRFSTMGSMFTERMKSCGIDVADPPSQIFTLVTHDIESLWSVVSEKLPLLINRPEYNIKLVIIDSLASLFRSEYEANQTIERARSLWMISSQLRKLSDTHNFAVVVVNQVTDKFDNGSSVEMGFTANKKLIPSLGLSWSKSINTRIMLRKTQRMAEIDNEVQMDSDGGEPATKKQKLSSVPLRELSVVFSSTSPNSTCMFCVQNAGLRGLE